MQELVDSLVADGFVPGGLPLWVAYLGAMLVFGGIVVFVFILPIAGITTWVERRVAGRIQSPIGPNRTGPAGVLPGGRPGRPKAGGGGRFRPAGLCPPSQRAAPRGGELLVLPRLRASPR